MSNAKRHKTTHADSDALYQAIYDRKWEKVRALLLTSYAGELTRHVNKIGESTLYWACNNNAPIDVVERIHSLRPSLILQRDKYGFTPLHAACYGSSREVAEFLLRETPEAAAVAECDDWLPLHKAINQNRASPFVRNLLSVHPTAVHAVNRDGDTSLRRFLDIWGQKIERVYPRLEELPRCDLNGVDDYESDGATEFERILSHLLMAHARGTVDNPSTSRSWNLSHEVVRHGPTVSIPFRITQVLLETSGVPRPDQDGNFVLHVACSLQRS